VTQPDAFPLRAVIFDFDGTLAHTLPICIEAFRRAAEPLTGRALSDAEIEATFGPSEEGSVRVLAPGAHEACLEAYVDHYERLHDSVVEPFPGLVPLLRELETRGVRLALVTGKGARSCEISLRRVGLAGVFEHVETGCEHGPCKPEGLRRILGHWGIPASRVAYVGDSPKDVDDAHECGMVAVAAAWAESARPDRLEDRRPDALFRTVEEFAVWLREKTM